MSDTDSHQELPGKDDYIIPAEYYDRYRLIFSHYNLDSKLDRIGKNGKQRQKSIKELTYGNGSVKAIRKTWVGIRVSRETDSVHQFATISSEIPSSQHLLN